VSHIYNQYISACQSAYKPCNTSLGNYCNKDVLCELNCRHIKNCVDCLSKIFRVNHERIYKCFPITYSYVMRFLNDYASEIYHILYNQEELWNDISNKNIMSIGCGPATELVAIERLLRDKKIETPCYYFGFDLNFVWVRVQDFLTQIFNDNSCLIQPCFEQGNLLPENKGLSNTKLLIINYVISDIYNHASEEQKSEVATNFLSTNINQIIEKMPFDSYVLINDINSNNMGRDEIEKWSENSDLKIISKGFFEYPKRKIVQQFTGTSSIIEDNQFIFEDTIEDEYSNRDNIKECHSAFLLLLKEAPF